ncbi:hypothetical protein HXX76_013397 [Chlamydomonas incerta]|uniref:LysM domain-containing protein n=1 Tax=Chlamydomonas incerta TaxID=51695 RepID=A0A835VQS8_CHLIN|nr:hypothetical protein HXX76_013397 [Chlamydomonas incerta]|eukprot:KAG2425772.1 hypothetical protein HXX76_013397 [Chlamydomonas incerta]
MARRPAYPPLLPPPAYPPDAALDAPDAPPSPPHPRRPAFPPWPPFRPRAPTAPTTAADTSQPPDVDVASDPPVAACAAWHVAAPGDTCASLAESYGLPYGSGLYLNGPYSSSSGGGGGSTASGGAVAAPAPALPGPGWTWLQRINPRLDCSAGPQAGTPLCVHRAHQWLPPPGGCVRAAVLADGQSCDQVLQMYGGGAGGGGGGGGLLPRGLEDLYDLNPGLDCRGLLRGLVLCLKARPAAP